VVERFTAWGEDKLLCSDERGNSRMFPTSWTDHPADGPENPFIGMADFWYDDLEMLARLIGCIEKV